MTSMSKPGPSSPHVRYLGGSFGRVSLLAPDVTFANHARDCVQILINVDRQPLFIDIDGRRCCLQTFQAILIHPRQVYAIPSQPRRSSGDVQAPGSILVKYQGMPKDLPSRNNTVVQLDARAREQAQGLLADLMCKYPDSSSIEQSIHSLFQTVLAAAATAMPTPGSTTEKMGSGLIETQIKARADFLVFDDINVFRDVGAVAQTYDISERHYFTLFRQATGLPPRAFYNMRRLELAFALLLDPSYNIVDIAYELGFSAPPHFTRFMRANTGWTPSAYRHAVSIMPRPLRLTVQHTVPFGRNADKQLRRLQ